MYPLKNKHCMNQAVFPQNWELFIR